MIRNNFLRNLLIILLIISVCFTAYLIFKKINYCPSVRDTFSYNNKKLKLSFTYKRLPVYPSNFLKTNIPDLYLCQRSDFPIPSTNNNIIIPQRPLTELPDGEKLQGNTWCFVSTLPQNGRIEPDYVFTDNGGYQYEYWYQRLYTPPEHFHYTQVDTNFNVDSGILPELSLPDGEFYPKGHSGTISFMKDDSTREDIPPDYIINDVFYWHVKPNVPAKSVQTGITGFFLALNLLPVITRIQLPDHDFIETTKYTPCYIRNYRLFYDDEPIEIVDNISYYFDSLYKPENFGNETGKQPFIGACNYIQYPPGIIPELVLADGTVIPSGTACILSLFNINTTSTSFSNNDNSDFQYNNINYWFSKQIDPPDFCYNSAINPGKYICPVDILPKSLKWGDDPLLSPGLESVIRCYPLEPVDNIDKPNYIFNNVYYWFEKYNFKPVNCYITSTEGIFISPKGKLEPNNTILVANYNTGGKHYMSGDNDYWFVRDYLMFENCYPTINVNEYLCTYWTNPCSEDLCIVRTDIPTDCSMRVRDNRGLGYFTLIYKHSLYKHDFILENTFQAYGYPKLSVFIVPPINNFPEFEGRKFSSYYRDCFKLSNYNLDTDGSPRYTIDGVNYWYRGTNNPPLVGYITRNLDYFILPRGALPNNVSFTPVGSSSPITIKAGTACIITNVPPVNTPGSSGNTVICNLPTKLELDENSMPNIPTTYVNYYYIRSIDIIENVAETIPTKINPSTTFTSGPAFYSNTTTGLVTCIDPNLPRSTNPAFDGNYVIAGRKCVLSYHPYEDMGDNSSTPAYTYTTVKIVNNFSINVSINYWFRFYINSVAPPNCFFVSRNETTDTNTYACPPGIIPGHTNACFIKDRGISSNSVPDFFISNLPYWYDSDITIFPSHLNNNVDWYHGASIDNPSNVKYLDRKNQKFLYMSRTGYLEFTCHLGNDISFSIVYNLAGNTYTSTDNNVILNQVNLDYNNVLNFFNIQVVDNPEFNGIYTKMNNHTSYLPNSSDSNYVSLGLPSTCNPNPRQATHYFREREPTGYVYIGNTRFPSNEYVGQLNDHGCQVNSYKAGATNNIYTKSFSATWMINSIGFIGNTPLNKIFLPGSHDTMTYGLPTPSWYGDSGAIPPGYETSLPYFLDNIAGDVVEGNVRLFIGPDANDIVRKLQWAYNLITFGVCVFLPGIYILAMFLLFPGCFFTPPGLNIISCVAFWAFALLLVASLTTCFIFLSLPNFMVAVGVLWSKSQVNTVREQLEMGIRYIDMRLAIDTRNGKRRSISSLSLDDLRFTHSYCTPNVNFTQAIDDIDDYIRNNNAYNEIIIIDFQYLTNFCTTSTGINYRVDDAVQLMIQQQALDYINNKWGYGSSMGNRIAPANFLVTHTYKEFLDAGYQFIIMFDTKGNGYGYASDANAIVPNYEGVNPNLLNFVDFWSSAYDWVRSRNITLPHYINSDQSIDFLSTFGVDYNAESDPTYAYNDACDTGDKKYGGYIRDDTLVVYGATVGLLSETTDFLAMTQEGLLNPSSIYRGNGLEQQSQNWAPVLINNFVGFYGDKYLYKNGSFTNAVQPPPRLGTHNIYLHDNVCSYNVCTQIISSNRSELDRVLYGMTNNIPKTSAEISAQHTEHFIKRHRLGQRKKDNKNLKITKNGKFI